MKHLTLLLLIVLTACTSKNDESDKKIAQIWNAENCTIENDPHSNNVICLTIKNPKKIESDYPNENITSMSAFTYINESKPEDYKTIDSVKVIIKE